MNERKIKKLERKKEWQWNNEINETQRHGEQNEADNMTANEMKNKTA